MKSVRLIATPLSHFARKSRIMLDLYKVPYEFTDIGNVALTKTPHEAGNNPLMKVPVLEANGEWIIESDHISGYIADQIDPHDRYEVHSRNLFDLNSRAVLNGIMTDEVKVIVAGRHQVPTKEYTYFNKCIESVQHGLAWLESNHSKFQPHNPKYREFHLVCMWDHLHYYDFIPLTPFSKIAEIVKRTNESQPVLHQTAPFVLKPKAS